MRRCALRVVAAAITLVVLSLTAVACGGGEGKRRLDLRIGVLLPLSGQIDVLGVTGTKSVNLALRQVNAAIREANVDHIVTLRRADEGPDPSVAIKGARKLRKQKSACVVGPWSSSNMLATGNQVFVPQDVPVISPAASADDISRIRDAGLLNRTVLADEHQGPSLAALMDRELGGVRGKTASIAAFESTYGKNLVKSFTKAWRERGGRVSATVLYGDKSNYRPDVKRLTARKPDAYVFFDGPGTFGRMTLSLIDTKRWKATKMWTTDELASPNLALQLALQGLRGVAPGAPDTGSSARAFDRLWRKQAKAPRQSYDAQTFDAFILCYLAAVAAGSTNARDMQEQIRRVSGPPGTKYTWQQLPEAIKALQKDEDIDYEGASGPIDLDAKGDVTRGTYDAFRFKKFRIDVYGDVPFPPGQPDVAPAKSKKKVSRRAR